MLRYLSTGECAEIKALLVVADGVSDRPIQELSGKTPLETARRSGLDWVAENGVSGLIDPVAPGVVVDSDVANMAMLGCDPSRYYRGRGAIEAAGVGLEVREGDVALRCNYALVSRSGILIHPRVSINEGLAKELELVINEVAEEFGAEFRHSMGFRCVLVLREAGPIRKIELPTARSVGQKPMVRGSELANVLNELVWRISRRLQGLGDGVPNFVLPWAAGEATSLPSFREVHGLRAACVAGVGLIKGLCRLMGMEVLEIQGATGDIDTNYLEKARAAVRLLNNYDFIYVHVEAPDEASHRKSLAQKQWAIFQIGRLVEHVLSHTDLDDLVVAVLGDHTTSTRLGEHVADPAPISIYSSEALRDGVRRFTERDAARGGLRRLRGVDILPLIKDLMGA